MIPNTRVESKPLAFRYLRRMERFPRIPCSIPGLARRSTCHEECIRRRSDRITTCLASHRLAYSSKLIGILPHVYSLLLDRHLQHATANVQLSSPLRLNPTLSYLSRAIMDCALAETHYLPLSSAHPPRGVMTKLWGSGFLTWLRLPRTNFHVTAYWLDGITFDYSPSLLIVDQKRRDRKFSALRPARVKDIWTALPGSIMILPRFSGGPSRHLCSRHMQHRLHLSPFSRLSDSEPGAIHRKDSRSPLLHRDRFIPDAAQHRSLRGTFLRARSPLVICLMC